MTLFFFWMFIWLLTGQGFMLEPATSALDFTFRISRSKQNATAVEVSFSLLSASFQNILHQIYNVINLIEGK